jgi:hypothetical protein
MQLTWSSLVLHVRPYPEHGTRDRPHLWYLTDMHCAAIYDALKALSTIVVIRVSLFAFPEQRARSSMVMFAIRPATSTS